MLGLTDVYTAFCLDEACAYIMMKMRNKEKPTFEVKYSSFKDLYAKYN